MAKKADTQKKVSEIEATEFTMKNEEGKKIKMVAPDSSLDKEGNAESALNGVYRHA